MNTDKIHFLDCGANKGQSIRKALRTFLKGTNYEIHSFEILPLLANRLKEYFKEDKRVYVYHAGVWIEDGYEKFYPSESSTESGTMVKEKISGKLVKDKFIEFPTIDFSKWIVATFKKNDYLVLKLDIEGAEYKVLRKLIEDETIHWFNQFYGEFHKDKMKLDNSETVKDIEFVENYLKNNKIDFIKWEAPGHMGYVDYKKGTKPGFNNSRIMDYDNKGNPVYYRK